MTTYWTDSLGETITEIPQLFNMKRKISLFGKIFGKLPSLNKLEKLSRKPVDSTVKQQIYRNISYMTAKL